MAEEHLSSDDELPDLDILLERLQQRTRRAKEGPAKPDDNNSAGYTTGTGVPPLIRHGSLGQSRDAFYHKSPTRKEHTVEHQTHGSRRRVDEHSSRIQNTAQRYQLLNQPCAAALPISSSQRGDDGDANNALVISSDSTIDTAGEGEDDEDDDTFYSCISSSSNQHAMPAGLPLRVCNTSRETRAINKNSRKKASTCDTKSRELVRKNKGGPSGSRKNTPECQQNSAVHDVAESLAHLNLGSSLTESSQDLASSKATISLLPPSGRNSQTLASGRKLSTLPTTPQRPSQDLFWNQDAVDEWNDECLPITTSLLPPAQNVHENVNVSKLKPKSQAMKKGFEQSRQHLAEVFLAELDDAILQGQLRKLTNSTGGIKIVWSKKLNTTAGRANWRKEKLLDRQAGIEGSVDMSRHYASIELAEKVIDNEDRLFNVIAHEFCHLANFMISGITGNPHGKEFKTWAAQVSKTFTDRGILVTTKHSYDIDFKYVWTCTGCGTGFKRHSRSIDPERHRCGACKGPLQQTKPIPRKTAANKSEYQRFVQEQMPIVKKENPGSPQKGMMLLIAQKWARRTGAGAAWDSSEHQLDQAKGDTASRLNGTVRSM
ncbi:HMG box-containing protein [Verticillium dahliae VdLs.17]|uniref:HMG box-containing protein n=2 Tax=Verticillium dahliae TaxID=27337 RepID=G2WVJ8_VERDV|nr:HMG box-containing protein [Verticillium dahliae VdLs.17]EGY20323.1 HMG box-containing protein [Verticillium dahliae VdLs.17]